jgi:hypothetical protein
MPDEASEKSLAFHFSSIADPRVKRTQAHGFEDMNLPRFYGHADSK